MTLLPSSTCLRPSAKRSIHLDHVRFIQLVPHLSHAAMRTLRDKLSLVSRTTLQQGLFMFAATSLVSVLNYVFQIVQSRLLGPRDYATLTAVLSLYVILAAPAGAAQAMLANYVARFRALGELGKISRLSRTALLWLALAVVPIAAGMVLFMRPIAAYLQLDALGPILALAIVILTTLLNPAVLGILQGLERFQMLSLVLLIGAVVRLASGLLLIWLGWGATGGVVATGLASVAGIGVGLFALRYLLRQPGEPHALAAVDLGRYGGQVLLTSVVFSIFLNLDVILVKHYFDPETAGHYSAAATVGKMVFFVPGAVGTLMFPRVTAQLAAGGDGAATLRKGAFVTLGLSGVMVAALFLVPDLITRVLFGSAYGPTAQIIGPYGLVMLFFALAHLLMLYHLSRHDGRFALVLIPAALLELAGVTLFHATLGQVLVTLGVCLALAILVSEIWLPAFRRLRRP